MTDTDVLSYDDLSEKVKARVRDRCREHAADYDWHEHVYEDAWRMGQLMGLHIGTHISRIGADRRPVGKRDIWFRGFWSQGDGCCWSGELYTEELAGALARVKAEAPHDEALHVLAQQAEELYAQLMSQIVANRLTDNVDEELYDGVRFTVQGNERNWSTSVDDITGCLTRELEKLADRLVDSFAAWIYSQLEAEYEYLTDNEQVDQMIEAMELSFDEDGNEL